MIRGLFVDFYGTLVHEDDVHIASIISRIQAHAMPGTTREEIGARWHAAFADGCQRANTNGFVSQESIAITALASTLDVFGVDLDVRDMIAPQLEHWNAPPLFDDTHNFLDEVKARDLPVFIVSNTDRSHIQAALALHNLSFDGVITSEDAGAYKPHPAIFEAALQQSGLRRDEILHIGDSRTNDVLGAQAAGIAVAWLNRSGRASGGGTPPDYEVTSPGDVLKLLERHPLAS